jgi:hypothetical protein
MANEQGLPPGFKDWPPRDPAAFIQEIQDEWERKHGAGKHWIVQGYGTNPLSGYTVKKEPAGGG